MKLYDCFVFHNEFDLLEIRLREMGEHVDRFVLVEANQTQRGGAKPYYFAENRERFASWADRIVDLQITFPDELPPALGVYQNRRKKDWERENYQRNCIARALDRCAPGDLVLLSDVDEIVRGDVLERVLREELYRERLLVFEQGLYKHHLNRIVPEKSWLLGSRMIEKKYLTTPQQLRRTKARMTKKSWVPDILAQPFLRLRNNNLSGISRPVKIVPDAGWHFSSMGGMEAFRTKLASVVHGQTVDTSDIERLYRRELEGTKLVPRERLPDCVREGLFDHMLASVQGNAGED
ncbi:MAG: benzoate transporter [Roseibium sp.]